MAGEPPQAIDELLMEVLKQPAELRTAYVDSTFQDEGTRSRLHELLEAHEKAGDFLNDSALPLDLSGLDSGLIEGPGTVIGRYRLVEQIGEGGFGAVFLAEQTHPVVRKVALKIIKLGMDTRQVIARFEAERQALAMMDHPGIAGVLDAGATDAGRPYFVMDLVEGEPITDYCDHQRLTVGQRLNLFRQVCAAVQHAHQKGIIHRDLKPSNILVTLADGAPVPKVIDFGIAKATAERLTERTLVTQQLALIGTPAYMSPEQAGGGMGDVDTRSDVYSLGVVLYELLSGLTPFDRKQLKNIGFAEVQRIIREQEPPRPSVRLRESSDAPSIAVARQSDPHKLAQLLRGELDWIVMKALEKDRSRRYETASALADDVQRYLTHEPVEAGPPSHAYRMQKFIRRNRLAMTAAALVTVALILGIIGTSAGMAWALREQARVMEVASQLEQEAARALAAEEEARQRADELEQVVNFQGSMIMNIDAELMGRNLHADLLAEADALYARLGLDPAEAARRRADLEAAMAGMNFTNPAVLSLERNVLSRAVNAIERQFKDQPLVEALLLQTVASSLLSLGRYESALDVERRVLEIRMRELGAEHTDTLKSLNNMGPLLRQLGRFAEAEPYLREAMEVRRRLLGDGDPSTVRSIANLAVVLQELGRLDEAEDLYKEVLKIRRRVYGDEHRATLISISNMGVLLRDQGRLDEAEPYLHEALTTRRRVLGDEDPSTLLSIANYGVLLHLKGRHENAESYLREAFETRRRVLGDQHLSTLISMSSLAALRRDMGDLDEAYRLGERAIRNAAAALPDDHWRVAMFLAEHGRTLAAMGRINEAETVLVEARTILETSLGPEHERTREVAQHLVELSTPAAGNH